MREDLSPDNIVNVLCGEILTLTKGDRSWQIAVCLPNMFTSLVMFYKYCQTETQPDLGNLFRGLWGPFRSWER